ncbi:MAG: MFS transporter [Lachnospiraceae bacterium]|nr:MFS transporter [Lachnospiraceae bacterium]MBR4767950.1 MFS transporter [Lachnospiraceae bacterium]
MEETYISRTSGIKAKDKIGYAMGDVGSLLVFGLVQSVLQKYYTDVVGINVVSIMIMFIVARVWDAVNDPIWGRIIDGAKAHKDGRYRHWIAVFAVPVAFSAVLMFIRIPGLSETGNLIYAYVTYILFGMLYTCINIPYGSMAQVITSSDKERSSLSVFRSVGSTFGAMPAMALISFCNSKSGDTTFMDYKKVIFGVVLISVLSIGAYFLCYFWSKERVVTKPVAKEKKKGETWKVVKALVKSRPFVAVSIASMLFLAAQMFQMGYNSYLFQYYFKQPGLTMLPTVCQYLPVAVVMLFVTKLGKKFGRREICSYGMAFAGVAYFGLFFLGTTNPWIYLVFCLLAGIGSAFIFLLIWALATDAIDYNEVTFGIHDEATSYAVYSFMRKLGQTVAAVLINSALLAIGYTDNVLNASNITDATLKRMYADSVLIPAVLFLLVFVLLRFVYPLSKAKIEELQVKKEALLKQMHEEN